MTVRTSKKTVTFRRPFVLGDFDEVLPAGAYSVETDEELLEDVSFPVWRRKLALIQLHTKSGNPGLARILTIDPNELDAALERDRMPGETPVGQDARLENPSQETEPRQEEADRQAVDRAEDEGMIVHPRQSVPPRQQQTPAQNS